MFELRVTKFSFTSGISFFKSSELSLVFFSKVFIASISLCIEFNLPIISFLTSVLTILISSQVISIFESKTKKFESRLVIFFLTSFISSCMVSIILWLSSAFSFKRFTFLLICFNSISISSIKLKL